MVASVALTVAYPLVFVRGRARWLPVLAVVTLGVQVLVEWGMSAAFGLAGVALGLGLTTGLVLLVLLDWLGALRPAVRGIVIAAATCGVIALAAYGVPRLVFGPLAAAAAGLIVYTAVLTLWRPPALRHAFGYMRDLE
jgi:hypothetical protein